MPVWMNLQELQSWGFKVSSDYKPVISAVDLNVSETSEEYYMRSFLTSSKLLESYPGKSNKNILLEHLKFRVTLIT